MLSTVFKFYGIGFVDLRPLDITEYNLHSSLTIPLCFLFQMFDY